MRPITTLHHSQKTWSEISTEIFLNKPLPKVIIKWPKLKNKCILKAYKVKPKRAQETTYFLLLDIKRNEKKKDPQKNQIVLDSENFREVVRPKFANKFKTAIKLWKV